MNTFYFQAIPNQVTNTSYSFSGIDLFGGGGLYTGWLQNAVGWQRQHIYQVGRDGQTLGKKDGENAPYPVCPYHMPTNYNRYNDPGLHVPYKKVKDLIELKDINRLIERITLYTHLWNADPNDLNGYGISSRSRSKYTLKLPLIETTLETSIATLVNHMYTKYNLHRFQKDNSGYEHWEQQVSSGALSIHDLEKTIVRAAQDLGELKSNVPSEYTYIAPSTPILTYERNTTRKNYPYIRIVDLSQAEYNSLNRSLFTPTSFLNNNQKMKDLPVGENSAITLPDTRNGKIQSSGNPVIFHCGQERLYRVTTYLDNNHNLVLAYHDEEKIAANSYNKNVQENIHFENRTIGNIAINNQRYFVISYREPDKNALKPELRYIVMKLWFYDSVLKTFNAPSITETKETDWSIQEQFKKKRGKHPIIQAKNFENIRNSLNDLIEALDLVAKTTLGGVPDSTTKTDIENFKFSHVKNNSGFDPNDPDTSFYGYQAQPQAIIKVGFYNTLVDAYKLLINSCMCNCDCACNSNCVCNTNCGCNYG